MDLKGSNTSNFWPRSHVNEKRELTREPDNNNDDDSCDEFSSWSQGSTDGSQTSCSEHDLESQSSQESIDEDAPKHIYLAFDIDGSLGSDFIFNAIRADNKDFAKDVMLNLLKECKVRPQDKVTVISGGDRRDIGSEKCNVEVFKRPKTFDVLEAVVPVINTALKHLGHEGKAELDRRFFVEQIFPDSKGVALEEEEAELKAKAARRNTEDVDLDLEDDNSDTEKVKIDAKGAGLTYQDWIAFLDEDQDGTHKSNSTFQQKKLLFYSGEPQKNSRVRN